LEAIHPRHHQIGDDSIDRHGAEFFQSFFSILGHLQSMAQSSDDCGKLLPLSRVVIDEQNPRRRGLRQHRIIF
jgi:hypothetical protein